MFRYNVNNAHLVMNLIIKIIKRKVVVFLNIFIIILY